MSAVLAIGGRDVSCFTIYNVSVDAGRQDIEEQPDGTVFNATMLGYWDSGEVGDEIELSDSTGVLFHGKITDLSAELDETMSWQTEVSAVGPLALLGQIETGDTEYPSESDVARVERVLDASGLGYKVLNTPDTFLLLPRAAELKPAAEIARAAASDGMGVLWENPADTVAPIRYTPHALRKWNQATPVPWRELPPALSWATADFSWAQADTGTLPGSDVPTITLDPCKVPAQVTFQQTISDLVRTVTVEYGLEALEQSRALVDSGTVITNSVGPLTLRTTFRFNIECEINSLMFYRSAVAENATRKMRIVDTAGVIRKSVDTTETPGFEGWVVAAFTENLAITAGTVLHIELEADAHYCHFAAPPVDLDTELVECLASESEYTDGVWTDEGTNLGIDVLWNMPGEEAKRPTVTRGAEPPQASYETHLAELADAETYAESMLRRHNSPAWRLTSISVDLNTLPEAERANIRGALVLGARLIVPFPNGSPVGPLWQGFVEGWKHILTSESRFASSHVIEFAASERRLTEAAETWADASETTRWLDVPISWENALDVP